MHLSGLNNTGYYVYIIFLFSLLVDILCEDANGVFEITSKASDGKKGQDGENGFQGTDKSGIEVNNVLFFLLSLEIPVVNTTI